MNQLSQKIKENMEKIDEIHNDTDCCQREKVKSHLTSSTLDILDTIEKWCEGKAHEMDWGGYVQAVPLSDIQNFIREAKEEIK